MTAPAGHRPVDRTIPVRRGTATAAVAAGTAGSAVLAATSWFVGETPTGWTVDPPLALAAKITGFGAAVLLCLSWVQLGRLVGRGAVRARQLVGAALLWLAPMLVALPIGSRDAWAYLGQSALLTHGADPYAVGPAAVPGPYARQVAEVWQHTPSPYGPLFLRLVELIVRLCGDHVVLAVLAVKALGGLALLLILGLLGALTRRFGGRPAVALWLVALNPLFLVIGVGGAHNDLVAIALLLLGVRLATGVGPAWRTLVPAAAVLTLAALVKAPAAVVLAFAPFLWLARPTAPRRAWLRGLAVVTVAVTGTVVAALVTVTTGLGPGWLLQVNAVSNGADVLSIPKTLAAAAGALHIVDPLTTDAGQLRAITLGALAATLLLAWLHAWRLRRPMWLTTAALGFALAMSTTVEPWYYCWPLVLAATMRIRRRWQAAAGGFAVVCTVSMVPGGHALLNPVVGTVVGTAAALTGASAVLRPGEFGRARAAAAEQVRRCATLTGWSRRTGRRAIR